MNYMTPEDEALRAKFAPYNTYVLEQAIYSVQAGTDMVPLDQEAHAWLIAARAELDRRARQAG